MAEVEQGQDIGLLGSTDFSWDSLPEVAKERWEQMVAYSSTIENQLAKAKASRAQAEVERQRTAKEILSATKEACQEVVADAKRTLDRVKCKTEEAERKQEEAKRQLEEATKVRAEADAYRETILARAEQQAEEMLQRARSAAEAAGAKLRLQVSFEAQRLLAQAEATRSAAREELEAQRIYAEAAMLKADAHGALDQLKAQLAVPEALNGNGADGLGLTWEIAKSWQSAAQDTQPPGQETPSQIPHDAPPQPTEAAERPGDPQVTVAGEEETTRVSTEEQPGDSGQSDAPPQARARERREKAA